MPAISRTISATAVIALGDASSSRTSQWTISITSLSGSHSIVTKGRVTGSGVAAGEQQDIAYIDGATGTMTDPGATPITAEGIYHIPADGMDVYLDVTVTSGSFVLNAVPLYGA